MLIKGLVCKETVMPAAINMSVKTPLNKKKCDTKLETSIYTGWNWTKIYLIKKKTN